MIIILIYFLIALKILINSLILLKIILKMNKKNKNKIMNNKCEING